MRSRATFESSSAAAGGGGPAAAVHRTATGPHSGWHSPVPYLFGGLAAMLGLIAFALLILACSYWKLSGHVEDGEGNNNGNGENSQIGDEKSVDAVVKIPPESFEQPRVVVIMAGDEKPTFLATPIRSRPSSFNDESSSSSRTVVDDDAVENKEMKNGKHEESQESMSEQV